MNKTVTNCYNCPMATFAGGTNHGHHYCNLDDSLETGLIWYYEDEEDAPKLPAPDNCPLRKEPITITINTTTK